MSRAIRKTVFLIFAQYENVGKTGTGLTFKIYIIRMGERLLSIAGGS